VPDRIIPQDIWTNPAVEALSSEAFRLYVAVRSAADDYGLLSIAYGAVCDAAPLRTWSRRAVAKLLAELIDAELIIPYDCAGHRFAAVCNWHDRVSSERPRYPIPPHGLTHCRKPRGYKSSKVRAAAASLLKHLPAPPCAKGVREDLRAPLSDERSSNVSGNDVVVPLMTAQVGARTAVHGPYSGAETRLPADWKLPSEWLGWALECAAMHGVPATTADVVSFSEQFCRHWQGKPAGKGSRTDWFSTWCNWFRGAGLARCRHNGDEAAATPSPPRFDPNRA
jgi:hypothetical protein